MNTRIPVGHATESLRHKDTDRGTGPGSTFSDLQDNYRFEGVFWGETGNPLVIIEELNASVILVPGEWWNIGILEENIPPDTKISSFLIL